MVFVSHVFPGSCVCSALAVVLNSHAVLIQGNAWSVSLPELRACLASGLDALMTVKSQRGELVCQFATVVAACSETLGVAAAQAVRDCLSAPDVPVHAVWRVQEPRVHQV